MNKIIEFQNVNKVYPNGNEAVKDINFSINEGEFIVFIGTSGSGKTTALKMINRLEDATSGKIEIKGKNIFEYGLCPTASGFISTSDSRRKYKYRA